MPYTPLDRDSLFSTAFRTGSLPWAVWTAILVAQDSDGNVAINPAFLAAQWGDDVASVEKAWLVHTQPDPQSKNREHEGRRIIPLADGRWHVVSAEEYRNKYRKEIRREQLRQAKQRARERDRRAKAACEIEGCATEAEPGQRSCSAHASMRN